MTPERFIDKWARSQLKERSAAQEHFIDLCHLLNEPTPAAEDPEGESYCFERGLKKAGGEDGWADVWKRGCFAWEYKGKKAKLDDAFKQLSQYALALESPPLHIACDTSRIIVKTAWTALTSETHEIELVDLRDFGVRQLLKNCFSNPDALKPGKSRQQLTEEAAESFAVLAKRLRERKHDPHAVAHFVNRLVFCMFAEDVGMLPNRMFERMLDAAYAAPAQFESMTKGLFAAMKAGGSFGVDGVPWFNGGLFDDDRTLPMTKDDIAEVRSAARLDWSDIDPSILGTLFERGLDPDKRSQLGAHYTDRDKIMMIVRPVVLEPLEAEWSVAKAKIAEEMEKARKAKGGARTAARNRAQKIHSDFLERLSAFRVLDPACGSGNFLYLALQSLKDLEHKANLEAEALGLQRGFPRVGPEAVKGIEINPYAAELARVSVWIGEIQWMLRNGFSHRTNPILTPLDNIECRDALLNADGTEAEWPASDAIVGNPPFLGGKRLLSVLGEEYTGQLRSTYLGRVEPFADFVCYWFEKARLAIDTKSALAAGFVATNSIRGGASREVLRRILETTTIFNAWADEPWIVDGAAVRVSLVCFGSTGPTLVLDEEPVARINADLTSDVDDITTACPLTENIGVCFEGGQKHGSFDIDGEQARTLLKAPLNPNGRPNSDVVRRYLNAMDIVRSRSDTWIILYPDEISEHEASLYEGPFKVLLEKVRPSRLQSKLKVQRDHWWLHHRSRPALRSALRELSRYLATPVVAKHRLFAWVDITDWPSNLLDAIARDDDTTFGILHSRFHELWALRLGTSLEDRPRYTPTTTFETFPFPEGLTPNIPASDYAKDPRAKVIAAAAKELNEKREAWLNPPDLVDRLPEVVPGFPDRLIPKNADAAEILKTRTLTKLYNERPAWLAHLHERLDAAVAAAYGWPANLSDDEVLARLFALNQERAKAGR
jgi:type II restriction/modification system DNA methylase subunit YeeA